MLRLYPFYCHGRVRKRPSVSIGLHKKADPTVDDLLYIVCDDLLVLSKTLGSFFLFFTLDSNN